MQAPPGALGDQLGQVLEVEDEHDDHAFLVLHGHHVHQAAETRRCRAQTGLGGAAQEILTSSPQLQTLLAEKWRFEHFDGCNPCWWVVEDMEHDLSPGKGPYP